MAQKQAFGHPKDITGKGGTFPSTLVPQDMLASLKHPPIPITVSGANNVTFTINASVTNPVNIWDGNDFIQLKETLAHTMSTASGNEIIATTGALATSQTPGSTGVKYYYIGMDTAGAIKLRPSTVKPSFVEGPKKVGYLGHPGTARDRNWRYVGFSYMSATTPVFDYFVKTGYIYNFSEHAYAGVDTQPGEISMAVVPKHSGVKIGGFVTGAVAQGVVELGAATDATATNALVGVQQFNVGGASAAAAGEAYPVFDNIPASTNGCYAHIAATATNVNLVVTRIHDVV